MTEIYDFLYLYLEDGIKKFKDEYAIVKKIKPLVLPRFLNKPPQVTFIFKIKHLTMDRIILVTITKFNCPSIAADVGKDCIIKYCIGKSEVSEFSDDKILFDRGDIDILDYFKNKLISTINKDLKKLKII